MWIILIILLVGAFFGVAILLAIGIVTAQDRAKKRAKLMLEQGRIDSEKDFERVSKTLATTQNDLEAADLWKRLQELKTKTK